MGSLNFCEDPMFLNVIYFSKTIIDLLSLVTPIVLIIAMMVDIAKVITGADIELGKIFKKCKNKLFAAAMVFFVPTIIVYVFTFVTNETSDVFCLKQATRENIAAIEAAKKAEMLSRREQRKNAEKNQIGTGIGGRLAQQNGNSKVNFSIPSSGSSKPFVNGKQSNKVETGQCMNFSDNCSCPTINGISGFNFRMADKTGRDFAEIKGGDRQVTVSVKCGDGQTIKAIVNERVKSNFERAFNSICNLDKNGQISLKDIYFGGTYVKRLTSSRSSCSRHSYGTAIDLNYNKTYTVGNKSFKPYAGQGTATREEYDKFVKAIGKESDSRNINYILWIKAFKPNGFVWGGDWSDSSFDPMHFEVRSIN